MSLDCLNARIVAVYSALEVPRIARRVIAALLVVHSILLAYSAYVHSPTLNEPGHLVAGLSYWKFGRFDLYRNNPPLVRMVAALPVMAVGYVEDWDGFYVGPAPIPIFGMGENFMATNGERTFFLMMIARWACIPFSWIGAIACFLWARDLYGRPAGLLAAFVWCFEPNILGHAALITSDVAGTALGVAACYTFWRWLKKPTWMQAALTGVILGIAELCKTTLIVFYPLWPLMWLIYRWSDRSIMNHRDWVREGGMLALRLLIGLYVLNLGYGFEGSFQQLKAYDFISNRLTGTSADSHSDQHDSSNSKSPGSSVEITGNSPLTNRFAGTWLGETLVHFPKHYVLGIDQQQENFENWSMPGYLRSQWSDTGWWYYYLYAALIKMPLAFWLMAGLALAYWLRSRQNPALCIWQKHGDDSAQAESLQPLIPQLRDEIFLLFPGVCVFALVSSQTEINEHFRYALPALPYFFIWTSQTSRLAGLRFSNSGKHLVAMEVTPQYSAGVRRTAIRFFASRGMISFAAICVIGLGAWFATSSLWIYPHSLSYFNESIGGPLNGPEHLLGSNVDWEQDVRYLRWWFDENVPHVRLTVYYFGRSGVYFRSNGIVLNGSRTANSPRQEGLTYLAASANALAPPIQSTGIPRRMPSGQLPDGLRDILRRSTASAKVSYALKVCLLD